jgi:serine/threonine protein kinase
MSTKGAPIADFTGHTLLGKWTVERLIGVGGTSTVLQARHRNGRRAALKILHPHLAAHGRTRERFLREGRLANLVNHPGVVAVLDDFMTDDGTAVLVLELVQGKTLATLAKEAGGLLHPREVVVAARAVLDILCVAHDANVIHRDIKPENILCCTDGGYKLADFGLAAVCHELGALTGTNVALGTPGFMSPEQARGDARVRDPRTDIWGLGATMFTLLTGRFLHEASPQKNLVFAAATEPPPAILSIDADMYPPLAAIIDRAVRMGKEDRWPNARAMLAAVQDIDVSVLNSRPVHRPSRHDAAMTTEPPSVTSWSHVNARLNRAQHRATHRLLRRVLFGAVIAVLATILVWLRVRPTTATTDAATDGAKIPATSSAIGTRTVFHGLPPGTVVALPQGVPERQREEPRSTRRVLRGSTSAELTTTPRTVPSASPLVSDDPSEREFSVPDNVLDRRK